MPEEIPGEAFAELRECVRHFLDDEMDRLGFVRLVELLHDQPAAERIVTYEYLLAETVGHTALGDAERVRALGRIADLVGREPPEVAERIAPKLRLAS